MTTASDLPQRRRSRRVDLLGIAAAALLVVTSLVLFLPLAYVVVTSFQPRVVSLSPTPTWFFEPTLDNYAALISRYDFIPYFINSLVSASGAAILAMAVSVPAAYALSRKSFRGFWGIVAAILAMRALPAIAVAVPAFIIFGNLGLVDTTFALIIVYLPFTVALATWLMRGYFESVPVSLDEAASVDGAGSLRIMWSIVMPVARPGMIGTFVVTFLFGWNNFLFPLVLTQTRAVTVPVALTQFIGEYVINWGQIMAGLVLLSLPLVVISFVLRRYMVSGLSAGAVRE